MTEIFFVKNMIYCGLGLNKERKQIIVNWKGKIVAVSYKMHIRINYAKWIFVAQHFLSGTFLIHFTLQYHTGRNVNKQPGSNLVGEYYELNIKEAKYIPETFCF